jgi:hypothetical protein
MTPSRLPTSLPVRSPSSSLSQATASLSRRQEIHLTYVLSLFFLTPPPSRPFHVVEQSTAYLPSFIVGFLRVANASLKPPPTHPRGSISPTTTRTGPYFVVQYPWLRHCSSCAFMSAITVVNADARIAMRHETTGRLLAWLAFTSYGSLK